MYGDLLRARLFIFYCSNGIILPKNIKFDEELIRWSLAVIQSIKKPKRHVYREYDVYFCQSCGVWACQFYTFQECKSCIFKLVCKIKEGESDARIICEDCPSCALSRVL